MLRRVVTHSRRLGIEGPVLEPLIRRTVELMGDAYPELRENEAFVLQVATSEEERFAATLRQGMQLFEKAVEQNAERKVLPGDEAFKLSDTFGFPLAADGGAGGRGRAARSTSSGSRELLEEQRARARGAAKRVPIGVESGAVPPTEFVGYQHLDADGQIVAMLDADNRELPVAEEGEDVRVFLNVTPFYAEGGGQIGDHGTIRTATGVIRVVDAQWAGPNAIMHVGLVESGEVRHEQEAHRAGRSRSGARRPRAPTRPRTSSTGRSSTCWASTRVRRARSSRRGGCASTSRIHRRSRSRSWRRRSWRRTGAWRSTMPSGSTRRRSTRRRRRARSRCSARSTATWCAWSRSGTTRASCAAGRTSHRTGQRRR